MSAVYVNYKPENIVEDVSINVNNGINLSVINENNEVDIELGNEEYIILNLWASWCTPCIEEVEHLKELSDSSLYYVLGLLVDDSEDPIKHPLINEIFSGKKGSTYFKPSN